MFKGSIERLKKISQKISAILEICNDDIDNAILDETIKQPAIMMHFINIYELLRGIQNLNDIEALSIFKQEEIQALSKTRNIASHEYEKINFDLIKKAIKDFLPNLKENIDLALNLYENKS